jgi:hypothetical protein
MAGTSFAVAVSGDADSVRVGCRRTVEVPFGHAFGRGDGVVRTALSSARSPVLP